MGKRVVSFQIGVDDEEGSGGRRFWEGLREVWRSRKALVVLVLMRHMGSYCNTNEAESYLVLMCR